MIVHAFCTPGGHSMDVLSDDPLRVPPGWTLVPASVIPSPKLSADEPWSPGIWFYDETSECKIWCCPQHRVEPIREGLS